MASMPYLVSGTLYNSDGLGLEGRPVTFTSSSGSDIVITNSEGKYLFDLDNIGYSSGETISYNATDSYCNQVFVGSFVVSGSNKTLNITLADRLSPSNPHSNRSNFISTLGGSPVSRGNPLPVAVSKIPLHEGSITLSYDGSGNLTTIVKVVD